MKIKTLLSKPSKWTRGAYARTSKGEPCWSRSSSAVSYCLAGAMNKCYKTNDEINKIATLINDKIGKDTISSWNDRHTYKEVKALVNKLNI